MKIYIDAGHRNNINDHGAVQNGQRESVLALQIAKKLKATLEKCNVVCFMSREHENTILTKTERCKKANNLKVDLFVSIHLNSAKTNASGIEVWYYEDKALPQAICDKMCQYTGAINRGPKQNKAFEVLNATKMPAVLVECGFLSNKEETLLLADEKYQDKLVRGLSEAILEKYKIVIHPGPAIKDEFEQSIHTLVAAGIIGSPDYWLKVTDANTRALIIKTAKYIEGRA